MGNLAEQLQKLEATWIRKGMPDTDWLEPGLDPAETERLMAERGLAAPVEVIEWFAWHNGVTEGSGLVLPRLGPTVLEPLSLNASFDEGARAADVARQAEAEGAVLDEDEGSLWEDSWLPLARDAGGTLLTIDLADSISGQVRVRRVNFWDVDMKTVRAESLNEVVEFWIDVLDTYCIWSSADRNWEYDFAATPITVRRRGNLL